MNQLCVPVPSASDTQQILKDVLALCRVPWIHDFIFCADPAADISMLLAPVQKRHALSARIFVNATETSSRYAHTFDFTKELMFYSIPAFSVGSITAGFCVEQPAARRSDKSKDGLQCIRFVRDDNKGVFLHVSENQRTGVTEVDCLTHKSSTRRTRVRMKFDYSSLRRVLRTPKGLLHPSEISSSLIYLNVSDERRACPICCDATAGHCGCRLPLQRPTHPLDFQFEASNMGLYTGFYQGATVVRLCSAGHSVINATLQSGSVIQGELNSELIARLHKMAVADRMSRIKERPSALILPSSSLNVPSMLGDDAREAAADLSKHNSDTHMDGIHIGGGGDDGGGDNSGGDDDGGGKDVVQDAGMTGEEAQAALDVKAALGGDSLFGADPDVGGVDFTNGDGLMDAHEMLGEMDSACQAGTEQCLGEIAIEQNDCEASVEKSPSTASQSSKQANSRVQEWAFALQAEAEAHTVAVAEEVADADQVVENANDTEAPEVAEMYLESTVPASNDGSESQSTGEKSSGSRRKRGRKEIKDDAKQAQAALSEVEKAEIRKKRNREAAARSNLKRKLRNESVRRDLASLTQRAIRLRVKEMMLRDENTRLRNALRHAKVSFLPGK